MQSMNEQPDPAVALVQYTGLQMGAASVRGRVTRRSYRYSASPNSQILSVDPRDLPLFEGLSDFLVLYRPPSREEVAAQERATSEARFAALEAARADAVAVPPAPPAKRTGRPPIPYNDRLLEVHLNRHIIPSWSPKQIAEKSVTDVDLVNPTEACRKRIRRFEKEHPEAAEGGKAACHYCRAQHSPSPA